MAQRNLALVVNPVAGGGAASALTDPVRERLESFGAAVQVVAETSAEQTRTAVAHIARSGVDGIVALGGDGLVHQLLQELAGTDVPLAIVPVGTGNDLAAAFAIPTDPLAAADLLATGQVRPVDAVRCGGTWWGSVLCSGFDSAVNERANRMRWPRGPRRYDIALLAELAALGPREFTIEYDGQRWSGPAILVAIGNTGQYGGGYRMVSQADPADGRLDLTIVRPVGRIELVRMLPKVKAGTHLSHPAVTTLQATTISLESEGMVGYADGERIGELPLRMQIAPGALRLWVPA
ncbi:MAG TPA: YegS/Rv2252/BmrU family lipid kinase [Mycobacteriales bacterium]|nr:YegS/Rv2252/BmrU family lipid kinase [Mycobacteriales bacterium]